MSLERIEILHLCLLALTALLALGTGWLEVGSLLFGGGVMLANFWLLKGIVRRVLRPGRGRAWAVVLFVAKLGLYLGLVSLVFWRVPVEGLSFAVGVTLLLGAAVIEALRTAPAMTVEGTV